MSSTSSKAVTGAAKSGGVQSVDRTLDLFEVVAEAGGRLTIAEITAKTGLPMATIHRLLRTLSNRGYFRQLSNRSYALGYRLVPLGLAANAQLGANAQSILSSVVQELRETANLAVLAGDHAEYVAQVPAQYSMRLFTEVGRRVDLHSTGVGKVLLAHLDPRQVTATVGRLELIQRTSHTLTSAVALETALAEIREQGFALDDEEHELGVRCVAVPVFTGEHVAMAVSLSGPVTRMTDEIVAGAVPVLQEAATRLAADVPDGGPKATRRPRS